MRGGGEGPSARVSKAANTYGRHPRLFEMVFGEGLELLFQRVTYQVSKWSVEHAHVRCIPRSVIHTKIPLIHDVTGAAHHQHTLEKVECTKPALRMRACDSLKVTYAKPAHILL